MQGTESDSESEYEGIHPESSVDSLASESEYEESETQGFRKLDADSDSPTHQGVYLSEKSTKKRLVIKDGKVVSRGKTQRKDKGLLLHFYKGKSISKGLL